MVADMGKGEVIRQTGQPRGRSLAMERQPGTLTLSEDDRRVLVVWAADCAEWTLSLFEAQARATHALVMP